MNNNPGTFYVGIDPGKSGGIALVDWTGAILEVVKMPAEPLEVFTVLRDMVGNRGRTRVTLERVHSMPGQGVVSVFTFGRGFGGLEMALAALGQTPRLVEPARWQATMGCRSRGDKNVTKAAALKLWPRQAVTHAIADALLIAEWGRRTDPVRLLRRER